MHAFWGGVILGQLLTFREIEFVEGDQVDKGGVPVGEVLSLFADQPRREVYAVVRGAAGGLFVCDAQSLRRRDA